jgi:hypothetical protein
VKWFSESNSSLRPKVLIISSRCRRRIYKIIIEIWKLQIT